MKDAKSVRKQIFVECLLVAHSAPRTHKRRARGLPGAEAVYALSLDLDFATSGDTGPCALTEYMMHATPEKKHDPT